MNQELSEREKQILRLIAAGLSNKEIACALSIAEPTVENHIHKIYRKLNISNRSRATAYAFQNGIAISNQAKSDW